MAKSVSHLPLCQKIPIKNNLQRAQDLIILLLSISLLVYRLLTFTNHGFPWFLAFLCESWFTFEWILFLSTKWTPVDYKTYPENLSQRWPELPAVDMFVTTADPVLEPPMITVNTVLSLMAVDYPAHKLACYVSDDGCSPLTLFSLMKASEFAKLWIPFCKKYNISVRAPFRYFSDKALWLRDVNSSEEFQLQWKKMKDEYEKLKENIETIDLSSEEYADFANTDSGNHASIVKVIWEEKERLENSVPHLIYKVSGVMTNAPYMLNVDCDRFANNPKVVLQFMCFFLDLPQEDSAFVQFPQVFYDELKDDPFGNFMVFGLEERMGGIQGPPYMGTGCFHRRKVIYCSFLDDSSLGKYIYFIILDYFCVVWRYGSPTEDVLTGMKIHAKGWKYVMYIPTPPAFLGTMPTCGPAMMTQRKRWAAGLSEVLLSKNSPILVTFYNNLHLRQCLAYTWIFTWALRSLPEVGYSLLPAYSILTDSSFLPKVSLAVLIIIFLFQNVQNLNNFHRHDMSFHAWWNNIRSHNKIFSETAMRFGVLSVVLKVVGFSEVVFEVTQKDQSDSVIEDDVDSGRLTFDKSPMFVPATALLFMQFAALVSGLLGLQPVAQHGGNGAGLGEFVCSVWVVLCFWTFVKGLFGKGKYGIPSFTIFKSACLALIFVHFCRKGSIY
ncbi:hypothetical protein UlMin_022985 [Ulmus minor]